jgi:hypothetical protein
MDVTLVTPLAGLVGLGIVVAVGVLVAGESRARGVASALGLTPRGRGAAAPELAALVLAGGLLALAAAQPIASRVEPRPGRTDAEAIFVLDISRSMEARERRDAPTRFERALAAAKELRAAMPTVPAGVASVTDRVLPHLFPTTSANAFTSTLDRAVGIQKPPPDRRGRGRATALGALTALATNNFYGAEAERRIAIVFTDGETLPVDLGTLRARLLGARVRPLFVRLWSTDDRIYVGGTVEQGYRPDPASEADLAVVALAAGGSVYDEKDLAGAADRARTLVGEGPTADGGSELRSVELAPHAAAAAFLPLLFLVWRRNLR